MKHFDRRQSFCHLADGNPYLHFIRAYNQPLTVSTYYYQLYFHTITAQFSLVCIHNNLTHLNKYFSSANQLSTIRSLYKYKKMYLKVRDVDLMQTADSGTLKEPKSDLTAVLYDETEIAQVNAPGRMVRILTCVTSDASLLQKGDEAAFCTPGLLYALIGWRPQRQVQTVVLRLHDVLGLA